MSETGDSNIEKRLKQFDQAEKHFENILAALEEYSRLIVDVASYLGLHGLRDIRSTNHIAPVLANIVMWDEIFSVERWPDRK
jgi:hypothetical protein